MITYFATYKENKGYAIIKVQMQPNDFLNRTETLHCHARTLREVTRLLANLNNCK